VLCHDYVLFEYEGSRKVTEGGGGVNGSLIKFFCKNRPMS
jgi:hypothetical protein